MVKLQGPHIATPTNQQPLDRPPPHRPASRPVQRPAARHIHDVLVELTDIRKRYEDLRLDSGPMEERAALISVLHRLRAEASHARNTAGRP